MRLLVSFLLFILLDSMFIYANAATFHSQILDVQSSPLKINLLGVLLSYIFLLGGLYYFILKEHRPVLDAFLLGLVIYGVYESTNYVAFKHWRLKTVIMDTLWGGILFGTTTYLSYKI